MRIASVAKLRALSVIACLLAGGALLGLLPGPSASIGQEQPSDLPANWQTLQASEFADLAEKYLLSATPQASSRTLLIQHAWKTFLASDDTAGKLGDETLQRLLQIANARKSEPLKILIEGLDANQQAQLLQRWIALETRTINATVAKLSEAATVEDLLVQLRRMGSSDNPFTLLSSEVSQQVSGWVNSHEDELDSASATDLLEILELMQNRGGGAMAVVYQAWISPPISGAYHFSQLRHGALEGAMTISIAGQTIYDSSKPGEERFESAPVQLAAGHRVLLEAVYTYDPKTLILVDKIPREAGSGDWPIVPVAGVLWKQGDRNYELISDESVATDADGRTPGVRVSYYGEPARTKLLFEVTQQSLGAINMGAPVSPEPLNTQKLLIDVLLKRDTTALIEPPLKPIPEPEGPTTAEPAAMPRIVYEPTFRTLVEALSPQQRETLMTSWLEQPGVLAKLKPPQMAQLWKQVYLLPGDLPLDLLVAWSDARTAWEHTLRIEERWELLDPNGGSVDATCNASAKQIAATMEGAFTDRVDGLLKHMIADDGTPRLPLVKIALAAAGNNYRLKDVIEVIDDQVTTAKDDGDLKAAWLIADAYKIEAVEAVTPHPRAISRLEEVSLYTENELVKQNALLEALARSNPSQETANEVLQSGSLTAAKRSQSGASSMPKAVEAESKNVMAEAAHQRILNLRAQKNKALSK